MQTEADIKVLPKPRVERKESVSFKKRGNIEVDGWLENFAWDAGERNRSVVALRYFVAFLKD